jgi:hypothetical protein
MRSDSLVTLLEELSPETDLARLVERVYLRNLSFFIVATPALTAWKERDPRGWARVSEWLAAKGITIVDA